MDEPTDTYTNAVNALGGFYDLVLEFSINTPMGPGTPDQPPPMERHGFTRVRMSWEHAKSLMAVLMGQISVYEKQVGKLPLPPELQKSLDEYLRQQK